MITVALPNPLIPFLVEMFTSQKSWHTIPSSTECLIVVTEEGGASWCFCVCGFVSYQLIYSAFLKSFIILKKKILKLLAMFNIINKCWSKISFQKSKQLLCSYSATPFYSYCTINVPVMHIFVFFSSTSFYVFVSFIDSSFYSVL